MKVLEPIPHSPTLPELERTVHRRVLVVLPAYNEEGRIGRLLDRIAEAMAASGLPYHVVVIEDGSQDETASVVAERGTRMPIHMQRHGQNMGLGPTIRDGLVAAGQLAREDDVIVTMDADDTQTPGLIPRMVQAIAEGHDVVIASRYRPGARVVGVPLARRFLSYGASWVFRILFPTPGVKDFTCGFRAYRGSVIRRALERHGDRFIDQHGFQAMVDILLKLRRLPVIFGEVPLILRYDQKSGPTKMRVARTIAATLALLVRRRLGS